MKMRYYNPARSRVYLFFFNILPSVAAIVLLACFAAANASEPDPIASGIIRVLDIEPEDASRLTASDGGNYQEYIRHRAGEWVNTSDSHISVDTITTRTLSGADESLMEGYDIIYIGTSGKKTDFSDSRMKGLVYYNIGDTFTKKNTSADGSLHRITAGMKDSDYLIADGSAGKTTMEETYRYSGNDITAANEQELADFMDQGHPLIVSDELMEDGAVSNRTVDANTRLYDLLNKYRGNRCLMSESTAKGDPSEVEKLAAGSSLKIIFSKKPADYRGLSDLRPLKSLDLSFTVSDGKAKDTGYNAWLYLDRNRDGIFSDDEELTEQSFTGRCSMKAAVPSGVNGAFEWELLVQTADSVQRHTSYKGISYAPLTGERKTIRVLQINANGNYNRSGTACMNFKEKAPEQFFLRYDQKQYYYRYDEDQLDENGIPRAGEEPRNYRNSVVKKDLGSTDSLYPYDLEALSQYSGDSLKDSFGKAVNDPLLKKIYRIRIRTIKASNFHEFEKHNPGWKKNYDVVIAGFGDSYGTLDEKALRDLKSFADGGKKVIFGHDCSSNAVINYRNADGSGLCADKTISSGDSLTAGQELLLAYNQKGGLSLKPCVYGAFDFNTMMRPALGMDVYGISDATAYGKGGGHIFGGSKFQKDGDLTKAVSGILASQDSEEKMDADTIKELTEAGYSIARRPESGGEPTDVTVPETQGYSDDGVLKNYSLFNDTYPRYMSVREGTSASHRKRRSVMITDTITQINRGLITSYPYDINAGSLFDSDNAFTVSDTHAQYYQLNLNAGGAKVWYTLDGGKDTDGKAFYRRADCVNNYYLYSIGNYIYTAAGHCSTDSDSLTDTEAQLLVNAIITAA